MSIKNFGVPNSIEFNQYISPDDEVYHFNNDIDQFIVAPGIGGMGMPSINYRTQRGPFQDGVTPLGFVLEPRVITLAHRRNGGCRQDYWDNRNDLLDILRPNRQALNSFQGGTFRKIQPNGTKRDLCVFILDTPIFVGSQTGRWDEFSYTAPLQFIAHDPLFFDPTQNLLDLTLPIVTDELTFSIEFSIEFSSDGSVPTDTITYVGNYKTFPEIIMQGPLTQPIITNITTQEKIKLDTTIASGRTVTISLEFGNKTVTDDLGTNLIDTLTVDSDLATFHIAPNPEAPDGVNQIGVAAGLTDANSRIAIKWFDRYIGQ